MKRFGLKTLGWKGAIFRPARVRRDCFSLTALCKKMGEKVNQGIGNWMKGWGGGSQKFKQFMPVGPHSPVSVKLASETLIPSRSCVPRWTLKHTPQIKTLAAAGTAASFLPARQNSHRCAGADRWGFLVQIALLLPHPPAQ